MHIICYYSLTGNTSFLSEKLSELLPFPLFRIIDLKQRHGFLGIIKNEWDAIFRKTTAIQFDEINFNLISEIFIITPVWSNRLSPAIRSFMEFIPKDTQISFLCTSTNNRGNGCFRELQRSHPNSRFIASFRRKDLNKTDISEQLQSIIDKHNLKIP